MRPFAFHLALFAGVVVLLLGANTSGLSQSRLQPDFRHGIDSPGLNGMPHHTLDSKCMRNEYQIKPGVVRKSCSPQSAVYVIDSALVRNILDTTTGTYYDTTVFTYSHDGRGLVIRDLCQHVLNGEGLNSYRYTHTYDERGHMLTELHEEWILGEWVNSYRQTHTYNGSGHLLTDLYESWTYREWVGLSRVTYTNDESGNVLTRVEEGWGLPGQWKNIWRWTYTRDATGHVLAWMEEAWISDSSHWVNRTRATHTYDGSGNMLTRVDEAWSNSQWEMSARHAYTYDGSGNRLTWLYERWKNGQWVGYFRRTYTYDGSGHMLTELSENWTNGEWMNSYRYTHTYDEHGQMLTELHEEWSNGQWATVFCSRCMYTFDTDGNILTYLHEEWQGTSWAPTPWVLHVVDSAGNKYGYSGYYVRIKWKPSVPQTVGPEPGVLPAVSSLYQNYPNPFNPSTTLRYTVAGTGHEALGTSWVRLAVYDMLGREVAVLVNDKMEAGFHEVRFDAIGLSSGVYFYRLQAGASMETKKFVLAK